jgi:hypothetical protein
MTQLRRLAVIPSGGIRGSVFTASSREEWLVVSTRRRLAIKALPADAPLVSQAPRAHVFGLPVHTRIAGKSPSYHNTISQYNRVEAS